MSGRGADRGERTLGAAAAVSPAVVSEGPAHATWAQAPPERAISSPGWTPDRQTPQVVAYLAVIGTRAP
jgi:hypothetical protein